MIVQGAISQNMIEQSLWVLLLGMAGIFIVMGVIALTVSALNHFSNRQKKEKPKQAQ